MRSATPDGLAAPSGMQPRRLISTTPVRTGRCEQLWPARHLWDLGLISASQRHAGSFSSYCQREPNLTRRVIMPLHQVDKRPEEIRSRIVYTSDLSSHCLPKFRMPEQGSSAAAAAALVRDELIFDGNSRLNLATFCTTWVEPEVRQLMGECVDKNMIDKDEYPQSAEIESRCVHILADLWHSPEAGSTIGCSTTGSSEAAMLGGLALKWRWRKRRAA